jgi:hypothetical protein
MYYQFKKNKSIVFSSGELAQLLGVTTQTIMNYRKKGMPYCSMTLWGYYEYNFEAIQWVYDNGYKKTNFKVIPTSYRLKMIDLLLENRRLKTILINNLSSSVT